MYKGSNCESQITKSQISKIYTEPLNPRNLITNVDNILVFTDYVDF